MDELSPFEERLSDALRARSEPAVSHEDAVVRARAAMSAATRVVVLPRTHSGQRRLLALIAATIGLGLIVGLLATAGRSPGPSGRMAVVGEDGLRIIDLADRERAVPVIAVDAGPEFSWSPDGVWIAYFGPGGLWLGRSTGEGRHLLAAGYETDDVMGPAWSPDSTRVALSRTVGEAIVIDVIDVVTGEVTTVSPPDWRAGGPRWSPDGTRLLFGAHAGDGEGDIYVVGADGSGLINLTDDPTAGDGHGGAEWSFDGTGILVSTDSSVAMIDELGSPPRTLVERTPVWPGFLTWWPAGGRFTFGDYDKTYVADLASGAFELLVEAGPILWSRDGRWFAFVDLLPGDTLPSPVPGKGKAGPRDGPHPRLGVYVGAPDGGEPPRVVAEDVPFGFAWEPSG
jgi:dipeptidyl aminopeptidase/acylaminoacyl peptidase